MVSVSEELKAARAAKAALNQLTTAATPTQLVLMRTLRSANHAAVVNHLGSGGALNEARTNVIIALAKVMHGRPTPERIGKTKAAIDAWIKELEAAKQ